MPSLVESEFKSLLLSNSSQSPTAPPSDKDEELTLFPYHKKKKKNHPKIYQKDIIFGT